MAEYIEREEVIRMFRRTAATRYPLCFSSSILTDEELEEIPSADVAPVRHGKFLFVDNDGYWYNECSVCGGRTENLDGSPPGFNYCPDCGAKMDLEV